MWLFLMLNNTAVSQSLCKSLQGQLLPMFHSQISYGSSCDCLSDKTQYPFFLRTVPSDVYQAAAMAHLMDNFHWVYVGTLAVDDDYSRNLLALFLLQAERLSVCIAFQELLPQSYQKDTLQTVGKYKQKKIHIIMARCNICN